MSLVAVASLRGAPGATTLAMGLAAAWPVSSSNPPLVVEADPDGGVLAACFAELRADRTLAEVAVALRRGFDLGRVLACARPVWGSVPVVVAPPSAEQAHAALAAAADHLAAGLAEADVDALVDVGRLTARSVALPLARQAAITLLVARAGFEDAAALAPRADELRAAGCQPALVVVGDRPYDPTSIAEAAEVPLVAVLPADPAAAALLAGGPGRDRRLRRSLLWRAIAELAAGLAASSPGAVASEPTAASAGTSVVTVDLASSAPVLLEGGALPDAEPARSGT